MKKVAIDIEIPDGYEVAKGKQPRIVTPKDIALVNGEARLLGSWHAASELDEYIILVKSFVPEAGKAYMASDNKYDVGLIDGSVIIFERMSDGRYVDTGGVRWDHCWPIPKDLIGE